MTAGHLPALREPRGAGGSCEEAGGEAAEGHDREQAGNVAHPNDQELLGDAGRSHSHGASVCQPGGEQKSAGLESSGYITFS